MILENTFILAALAMRAKFERSEILLQIDPEVSSGNDIFFL